MRVLCLLLCLTCAATAQEKSYAAAIDAVLNDEFDKARGLLPDEPEILTLPEYAALSFLGRESLKPLRRLVPESNPDSPTVRKLQAIARNVAETEQTQESRRKHIDAARRLGPCAVHAFSAMLEVPDPRIRNEAASILGGLRDARAIAPLSAAEDTISGDVASSAHFSLILQRLMAGEFRGERELTTAQRYERLAQRYLATRELDLECFNWSWKGELVARPSDPILDAALRAEAAAARSRLLRPDPWTAGILARSTCLASILIEGFGTRPGGWADQATLLTLRLDCVGWSRRAIDPDVGSGATPAIQARLLELFSGCDDDLSIVSVITAGLWSPIPLVRNRALRAVTEATDRLGGNATTLPFELPHAEPPVLEAARKLLLAADLDEEDARIVFRALERALGGMETAVPLGPGTIDPAPEFVETGGDPEPTEVVVFYGTDRAEFSPSTAYYASEFIGALIALLAALILPRAFRWMFQEHLQVLVPLSRWLSWTATVVLAVSATYTCARVHLKHERLGFEYGGKRGPFDDDKGPYCHFGRCIIGIPPQHLSGEVERPQPLTGDLWEDPDKHVLILSIEPETDKARFFGDVRERAQAGDNSAFVFVHGFNVTFEDAALRTAQMTHDLNFQGAPIFFSWPSRGSLLRYTYDESTVAWATRHLKRFLRDVRKELPDATIHLVAHSMGNRAMTEALRRLASEIEHNELKPFQEVVLAAPDIDAATFRNDIVPAIRSTAERVTLYASSSDEALVVSKQVHGYPRAGDSGERIVVVDGIQTIDVSASLDSSVLGHSYYGSVGRVLDDLVALLRKRHMPKDRGLAEVAGDDGVHWRLE